MIAKNNVQEVFPACAGVIPDGGQTFSGEMGIPRVCGGDPAVSQINVTAS